MRYYQLNILKDGNPIPVNIGGQNETLGPFDTSQTPSFGLHIEFDILIQSWDTVSSGTVITLFGLPVEMLSQYVKLEGCQVTLEAGFQQGLPLANPNQNGIILMGHVYSAYANWLGTNQCLILNVTTQQFDNLLSSFPVKPIQMIGNEKDKLADVIRNALKNAYPDYQIDIDIADKLVLTEPVAGVYPKGLRQFAIMLRSYSRSLNQEAGYDGVRVTIQGNKIVIWDNHYASQNIKTIAVGLSELIGQPTWIDVNTISFKCPLRADIKVNDYVQLSENPFSEGGRVFFGSNAQIFNSAREKINFSGNFQISSIRHIGQYLNADANNAWVTVFEANVIGGGRNGESIPLPEGEPRPPRGVNL